LIVWDLLPVPEKGAIQVLTKGIRHEPFDDPSNQSLVHNTHYSSGVDIHSRSSAVGPISGTKLPDALEDTFPPVQRLDLSSENSKHSFSFGSSSRKSMLDAAHTGASSIRFPNLIYQPSMPGEYFNLSISA
jgi:hypothetical protein